MDELIISEQALLDDPATSNWLKQQIASTAQRDPVDALNDAEVLVNVLNARLATLRSEAFKKGFS